MKQGYVVFILLVLVALGGYFVGKQQNIVSTSSKLSKSDISQTDALKTVNYNGSGKDRIWTSFQIKFPPKYSVTDDNMLQQYNSSGGMSQPILVFKNGDQFLPESSQPSSLNCIEMWLGTQTFDDWNNSIFNTPVTVLSENIEKYNGYIFTKRTVQEIKTGSKHLQVRFMPTDRIGYLLNTCNANNEDDLETIMQNIHFLANNPPQG